MKLETKHMKVILNKLFSFVNLETENIDLYDEMLMDKITWTLEQQRSFRRWLRGYLLHNNLSSRKQVNKLLDYYLLNYGWRLRWNHKKIMK